MTQAIALLTNLVAFAFVALGAATAIQWLRDREPARGYLALAVGLLAVVALVGRITTLVPQAKAPLTVVSVCAFLGSGYALLMFRSHFVPLPRAARVAAGTAAVISGVAGIFAFAVEPPPATPRVLQAAAAITLILVWIVLVCEPVVRFWLASRGLPRVQKARLRTLSLGFGGIAAILLIAGAGGSAFHSQGAVLVTQLVALTAVPLIYASFSPPAWLRAWWRAPEENALRRGLQDLVLFSPSRAELSQRAVEWASRLVGAGAAMIAGEDTKVLAATGLSPAQADELAERIAASTEPARPGRTQLLDIPLHLRGGPGRLVVMAGPFTPLFGSDEVQRLEEYSAAIAAGLDRAVVTERIAAMEKVKTQFLNLASHELRGPLTVIRGYVAMLDQGSLGELNDLGRMAASVLSAKVVEMNGLVEQMIEAARLEEGRVELDLEPVDLGEITGQAVALVRPLLDGNHRLLVELPRRRVAACIDRARTLTIIGNLIDNAIKYSPAGGDVTCEVVGRNSHAEVRVHDHGLGIGASDLPHLFTRFGRLTGPDRSHIGGTGLGLYLSRELARLQQGDITVESRLGKGSTFCLSVPLAEKPAAAEGSP